MKQTRGSGVIDQKIEAALVLLFVFAIAACSPSPPEPGVGEQVVKSTCMACHASGLNGAPIIGNKKMWAKRLPQGTPVLVEHATQGFGLMPAKGGNTDLTDEQIEKAVGYLVSQVE